MYGAWQTQIMPTISRKQGDHHVTESEGTGRRNGIGERFQIRLMVLATFIDDDAESGQEPIFEPV